MSSDFTDRLQQAKFRNVPFGVLSASGEFGRRLALHEYPFRDRPYAEDLGRATRRIHLRGFLVEDSLIYGGGDVIAQRDRMIAAAETEGPGTLIHPTLGSLQVSCGRFMVEEGVEEGLRYFAIGFSFLESGARQFPSVTSDTGFQLGTAADAMDIAAAQRYALSAAAPLRLGTAVIGQVGATAAGWLAIGTALARDATTLFRLVSGLSGNFGRYFSGRNAGAFGIAVTAPRGASTGSLIVLGATFRATIAAAGAALAGAAATGNAAAIAAAAQAYAASLLAAAADPADGVRLTAALAAFAPDQPTSSTALGSAMAAIQTATGAVCRRAAIAALARAARFYQPSSADDAIVVRNQVVGVIEQEITIAGDAGEDDVFNALIGLRTGVATDLNARGAALPPLRQFELAGSLPSLTLALRLYRNAGRSDELVSEAAPVHPLFMPRRFKALAS